MRDAAATNGSAKSAASSRLPGEERRRAVWEARYPARFRIVWVALAVLLAVIAVVEPQVLSGSSLKAVTALTGVLVLIALGTQLVLQTGQIDLSPGATITLVAAAVVHHSDAVEARLGTAIGIALAAAALIGLVNGLLIGLVGLNALIVTLATASVISGVTLLWLGVPPSPSGRVPDSLYDLAHAGIGPVSVVLVIALAAAVGVAWFLRRAPAGRRFVAIGGNPAAAEVLGLRVRTHRAAVYVFASTMYGVAGVLAAGFVRSPDMTLGEQYLFTTIVAVALGGTLLHGGTASVSSTVAACVFLTLLDQLLAGRNIPAGYRVLVQGVVLVLAVAAVNVGSTTLAALRRRARREPPSVATATAPPA
ncbi:ABC transporter permease [Actinocorallia sp. B10E7]